MRITAPRLRLTLCLTLSFALAACGGGGDEGDGGTPTPDTQAPTAVITAPADGSTTFASSVTVTGAATDNVGVTSVSVNGVAATSTTAWSASVPLVVGANTLTVAVSDAAGNTNASAASITVTRQTDSQKPTAAITFPPGDTAATTGASVTVAGTATDVGAGVSAVSVNGVGATSTDGFATWRASVPLALGSNTLTVAVTDAAGNAEADAAQTAVTRSAEFPQRPFDVAQGASVGSGNFLLADNSAHAVLRVDAATGATTVLSSPGVGTGVGMGLLVAVVQGFTAQQVFALDQNDDRILEINIATGDRTVISDASTGSGPALVAPTTMIGDLGNNRVLVLDQHSASPSEARLVGVDLTTGARTVLSGDGVGAGWELTLPQDIAVDTVNDRWVVIDASPHRRVHFIDRATGDRTNLDGTIASYPFPGFPIVRSLLLDGDGSAGYVIASTGSRENTLETSLFRVDLVSGVWSLLTWPGGVPDVALPQALIRDAVTMDLVMVDRGNGHLYRIELANTTTVSAVSRLTPESARVGGGAPFLLSGDVSLDRTVGSLYYGDSMAGTFSRADVSTGDRTVVSDDSIGTGPAIGQPFALFADPERDRLIGFDAFDAYAIDPATGDRTSLTGGAQLGGQAFSAVLDGARDRVLFRRFDSHDVLTLDVVTGAVTTFATGAGTPAIDQNSSMAADTDGQRLLVVDGADQTIIGFDLATGARTLLHTAPTGVTLDAVAGDAEQLFYLDLTTQSVYRVEIATGTLTVVHDGASDAFAGFTGSADLEWDPVDGVLYLLDFGSHALTAIDPVSGDRVIISR